MPLHFGIADRARVLCGILSDDIGYTFTPEFVTCKRCLRMMAMGATVVAVDPVGELAKRDPTTRGKKI